MVPDLTNAALVVAHPDDEILWFSSIINAVSSIHICYLDIPGQDQWSEGRCRARDAFPLDNTHFVGLTESVAFRCADWADPQATPYGLALTRQDLAKPGFDAQRYADNFDALKSYLERTLKRGQTVFTHSPWGEYGHEEHVQVFRAVDALREPLDLQVWHTNYVSDRSANLMTQALAAHTYAAVEKPTDLDTAKQIEALYRDTDCWTWPYDNYAWFESECLIRIADGPAPGTTLPLNFINVDGARIANLYNQRKERLASTILSRLRKRG